MHVHERVLISIYLRSIFPCGDWQYKISLGVFVYIHYRTIEPTQLHQNLVILSIQHHSKGSSIIKCHRRKILGSSSIPSEKFLTAEKTSYDH